MRAAWWMAVLAAAMGLAACGETAPTGGGAPPPLLVVATTAQVADAARGVAAGRAGMQIDALMGEGVDPHTYKLTRSDSARLHAARLVLFSGLHLEGKMTDVLSELKRAGTPVVEVGEALPHERLIVAEGGAGQNDPHYWMDADLFALAVGVIADALTKADPAGGREYAVNAQGYIERLRALDAYAKKAIGSVPEGRRVLVTSHDAFAYFGRRYGLRVLGVQGISTESEAGLKDIEALVETIVKEKIPAVFVETSVSRRTLEAVIAGAAARGHTVTIGGELFSDAMGAPGTYEGTYIGMLDHNITTIARALGGDAPERGLNGRLAVAPRGE